VSRRDWLGTPLPEEFPIVVKGARVMKNVHRKWWLTIVAALCLASAASAAEKNNPRQMPEGGSAAVYLLGAGITCLGAMVVRSRFAKPKQL
jgi:hypothetical protein